jgi:hypothetical protein
LAARVSSGAISFPSSVRISFPHPLSTIETARIAKAGTQVIIPYREEDEKRHLKVTGDLGQIVSMVRSSFFFGVYFIIIVFNNKRNAHFVVGMGHS